MTEPYDPKRKYCGPGNGLLAWLVADRVWGVPINECCYWHDEQYRIGGTGKDRANYDAQFRRCIESQFRKTRLPRWLGRMVARRYYVAVRVFGSVVFNYTA